MEGPRSRGLAGPARAVAQLRPKSRPAERSAGPAVASWSRSDPDPGRVDLRVTDRHPRTLNGRDFVLARGRQACEAGSATLGLRRSGGTADAADLNSAARKGVRVRISAPAPRVPWDSDRVSRGRQRGCAVRHRRGPVGPLPLRRGLGAQQPFVPPADVGFRLALSRRRGRRIPTGFTLRSADRARGARSPGRSPGGDRQRRKRNTPPDFRSSAAAGIAGPSSPNADALSLMNRSAGTERGALVTMGTPSLEALR